jgi:hypothetical protein
MRIKLYKEFITEAKMYDDKFGITPELESDVKDIFVELRDLGIEVDVQRWISQSDMICITLSPIDSDGERDRFKVESVKEYVMMLIDYMKIKYDVKSISYDLHLGDIDRGETMSYSFDEFPDEMAGLDTDEFGINFEVPDYEISEALINEGFGDFSEADYDKIESDVNDMFIELKDSGAKVNIDFYHKGVGYGAGTEDYMIKVRIYSDRKFSMSDVEEPTRMMVDYFKDLTDRRIDMEYQRASDYTNTRQSKFNPYSFDNEVTIYLIERA